MTEKSVKCPLCGYKQVKALRDYQSQQDLFLGLSLKSCANCDLVFADPMPAQISLDEYNSRYFSNAHGGVTKDNVAQAFFSAIALSRMADIEAYAAENKISIGNVLEIGPGTGKLAWHWLRKYPGCNYMAIEPDNDCHPFLIETGVRLIEKIDLESTKGCDLLIMSHVVEHVSQPNDFITQFTKCLKPNSIIFIEVPCNDYLHKEVDEPHLLFFDKKPMRVLLSNIGFANISLSYRGKTIDTLVNKSVMAGYWERIRLKLLQMGIIFGSGSKKMNDADKHSFSLEKSVASIYKFNNDSANPAWWLRAMGRLGSTKEIID